MKKVTAQLLRVEVLETTQEPKQLFFLRLVVSHFSV